jgi:hypothetical protein
MEKVFASESSIFFQKIARRHSQESNSRLRSACVLVRMEILPSVIENITKEWNCCKISDLQGGDYGE